MKYFNLKCNDLKVLGVGSSSVLNLVPSIVGHVNVIYV